MTDLDKKIIEYIEPYMDTTPTTWCLVKDKTNWEITVNQLEEIDTMFLMFEIDIIGHYDITAVLKYINISLIKQKNGKGLIMCCGILNNQPSLCLYDSMRGQKEDFIWEIPNKPLNLYPEEEKKNLITIFDNLEWW